MALLHPHLSLVRTTPLGKRISNKILKTTLLHDLTNDACSETPTYLATSPCAFPLRHTFSVLPLSLS